MLSPSASLRIKSAKHPANCVIKRTLGVIAGRRGDLLRMTASESITIFRYATFGSQVHPRTSFASLALF